MTTANPDDVLAKGEEYSKVRQAAFKSYSNAADLVRERLKALAHANEKGGVQALMDRLERDLAVAVRLKELTVLELQHADENWREWKEEQRWEHEQGRLTRQEKTTTSATCAAWGAFLAALASAFATAWPLFGPARPR